MTATIVENDVDTTDDYMLDSSVSKAIPCDSEDDKEAVWKVILSCCAAKSFICQDCMDELIEDMAADDTYACICNLCSTVHVPPRKIIALAERI